MSKKSNKGEVAAAVDEALERNILTGEVLRERGLCPLVVVRCRGAGVHVGPGCNHHWEERNRELAEELRAVKASRDGLLGAIERFDPFLDEAEEAIRKLGDRDEREGDALQRFYDARAAITKARRSP